MSDQAGLAARIETAFTAIQRRMDGVPVVNPALRVEMRALARVQEAWSGVLITPWFMNLMILPDAPQQRQIGTKAMQILPSGQYEAVWGHEAQLGGFWAISLFSPMFEFPDQPSAVATADAVWIEMMAPPAQPNPSAGEISDTRMEMIWAGATAREGAFTQTAPQAPSPPAPSPPAPSPPAQVSRRALFRLPSGEGSVP